MNQREIHALNDAELWAEATAQQLERIGSGLKTGAWFKSGDVALRLDADLHLLIVAAEHLRIAMEDAPKRLGLGLLPDDLAGPVQTLRDVVEHRDQHLRDFRRGRPPKRAAKKLLDQYGTRNAWQTTWGPDGFTIAGVLDANALGAVVDKVRDRVAALRQQEP